MGGKVRVVTSQEDYEESLRKNKVVLVDFYATWCGPCKKLSPILESISVTAEFQSVTFLKVDVDDLCDLAENEDINAMPTFKIFKDGNIAETLVGSNVDLLKKALRKAIA